DALIAVVEFGMNQGAIQIGPGRSESIREIAETIVALSGKDIPIRYDTRMPEGDTDRTADWSKARTLLGWSPRIGIAEGLARTYSWCQDALRHDGAVAPRNETERIDADRPG
ncbi:MAG TPA: hypothetical protein VIY86_15165, partial [Pirellulaceae bacterium]